MLGVVKLKATESQKGQEIAHPIVDVLGTTCVSEPLNIWPFPLFAPPHVNVLNVSS